MNRRNFLRNILVAGASFAVLPPATTYSRIWRASHEPYWGLITDLETMEKLGFRYHSVRSLGYKLYIQSRTDTPELIYFRGNL